jgi:NADH-quinone oxidoreductase subunit G
MESGTIHPASLKDIASADAILILGEDVWNTAPVMALAVRQSVQNTADAEAAKRLSLPVWNTLAIREFTQDSKGFLANFTVAPSPLDEISAYTQNAAPDTIARLGFAIAHLLRPSLPEPSGLTEQETEKAAALANALRSAKRPVVISGMSCRSDALIRATYDIAAALDTAAIAYVLPECNSMGLATMRAPSVEAIKNENITAIILENDLYRVLPEPKADAFFARCRQLIVLDSLNNRTTAKAGVLIPAATFAESDGTFISNEGRAQRFFQVFIPQGGPIKESWKWLRKIRTILTAASNGHEPHPDQLLAEMERSLPQLAGISAAAPPQDFRIHGEAIAREPHRYSGRTAMLANLSVSEPGPGHDGDSPLSFTMEGYQGIPPAPLIPFYWAPGWNSVQSVNKYQQTPGGSLRGGDPGRRLFEKTTLPKEEDYFKDIPEPFSVRPQKWLLLPQHDVVGSGELSIYTKALHDLTPKPYAALSPNDARQLSAADGSTLTLIIDQQEIPLPIKTQKDLPDGVVLVPAGIPEMPALTWGAWIGIQSQTQQP